MTGLDLVAVIRDEGVSASKELATRRGGAELLSLVTDRGIKNLVSLKLDRLFRDAADCPNQTRAWDEAKFHIAVEFAAYEIWTKPVLVNSAQYSSNSWRIKLEESIQPQGMGPILPVT